MKFLKDFCHYLHVFRLMPLRMRVRAAWHCAEATL